MSILTEAQYKMYNEYFNDYQTCPRLSDWEQNFMDQQMNAFNTYEYDYNPSPRQAAKIQHIMDSKVYV